MSIASEITRLQTAKADLKTAIEGKGVTVPNSTKLDGYADLVDSISGGGDISSLLTKGNLVQISTHFDSTDYTLNGDNNFSISNATIFNVTPEFISLAFNNITLSIDVRLLSSVYNKTVTFLSVGDIDFKLQNDPTYTSGFKHLYFYLNNEIIGTIAFDD